MTDDLSDLDLDGAEQRLRAMDAVASRMPLQLVLRLQRNGVVEPERPPSRARACRCARPIGDGDGWCLRCGRETS